MSVHFAFEMILNLIMILPILNLIVPNVVGMLPVNVFIEMLMTSSCVQSPSCSEIVLGCSFDNKEHEVVF